MASQAAKDADTAYSKAVQKLSKSLEACKDDDIANITRLAESLAKLIAAKSKGGSSDGDEWGSGLKPKRGEK